jgi:2-keto-4-pentenoate hydratase/2-oxohepta-3-ene-1,7-dioic acid hydratase in catechol pathway
VKLALFDADRLGIIDDAASGIADASSVLPEHSEGLGAGFWVRLCRDFDELQPQLREFAESASFRPLSEVTLRAPALNPTKVIAAAGNYTAHIEEMLGVEANDWRAQFDVFLKAPSSISGPGEIVLPDVQGEIHYECELAFVIGKQGRHISEAEALQYVRGWTILLDITERGVGDRSRRKSYDGFTPIGPWLTLSDEVPAWQDLEIDMKLNGVTRQHVRAGDMIVPVPEIIRRASAVMTLFPGDIITTGSPPGVGKIERGDRINASISGLGTLEVTVA